MKTYLSLAISRDCEAHIYCEKCNRSALNCFDDDEGDLTGFRCDKCGRVWNIVLQEKKHGKGRR